jgi:hypothetical protein
MKTLTAIVLGLGIVLMAVSFAWPRMIHKYLVDTNKKEIARAVDAMGVMHRDNATPEDRASAREVHRVARGNVDSRLQIRQYGIWISRTLGVLLTILGVGMYLRLRGQAIGAGSP